MNNDNMKDVVKKITKKVTDKGDGVSFDEREALRLTLKKYVNLDELKRKLSKEEQQYYKENLVSFVKARMVNFQLPADEVYSHLSNRIYDTRNSIVHSKDNGKHRYIPFKDDSILQKEISLLQRIAEEVMISSSELLE